MDEIYQPKINLMDMGFFTPPPSLAFAQKPLYKLRNIKFCLFYMIAISIFYLKYL